MKERLLLNLLSRKFLYAANSIVLGFILVLFDKATAEAWFTFVTVIGGIYVIGNVVTKSIPGTND